MSQRSMKRALALAIFAGHSMAVTGCGDDAASSKPTPSTPRADGGSPVGGAGGAASGGLGTGGADTGTGGVGGAAPDAGTGGTSDGPQPGPPTAEITLDRTCPSPKPLGSGAFGCWISDRFGRPAYLYTAAPGEGAAFTRREGPAGADDHWHQLGNFRVTASAHADGRVRLFDGTRGGKWVSPYSEHRITTWDGATLPTAGRRLVFGTGYVQVSDAAGDVRSERSVFAPFGDVPALVVEHRLQNLGAAPTEVEVVETWDAAMEQLTVALTYGSTPQLADGARDRLMGSFVQAAERDADGRAVRVHTLTGPEVMRPDPAAPAEFDFYPGTLALASLDGPVSASAVVEAPCEAGCTPRTLATKGGATTRFGPPPNGLAAWEGQMIGPQAATRRDLAPTLARRVSLPPGTEVTLRFAVAYADTPAMDAALEALRAAPPTLAETVAAWAEIGPEVRFPAGDDTAQALAREFAWHGPYLLGAANYDAFYGVHAIDQGSAYGYLQGLRGAARDNLINAVAALPLAPWLAAEQIRYILGATHPDGTRISYGTSGFGELQNAVVHRKPSDLDLWLLWAVVEYVQGTRDFAFLDTPVELHRDGAAPGPSLTVAARLGTSLDWLEGEIGYGEHGLLRVGSGDWSDGISFLAPDRVAFEANGESVFNSAFAAYVFPRIAGLLDGRDDALAARYRTAGEALRMAVASQFQGRWFTRAWDGGSPPAPIAADDGTDEARLSPRAPRLGARRRRADGRTADVGHRRARRPPRRPLAPRHGPDVPAHRQHVPAPGLGRERGRVGRDERPAGLGALANRPRGGLGRTRRQLDGAARRDAPGPLVRHLVGARRVQRGVHRPPGRDILPRGDAHDGLPGPELEPTRAAVARCGEARRVREHAGRGGPRSAHGPRAVLAAHAAVRHRRPCDRPGPDLGSHRLSRGGRGARAGARGVDAGRRFAARKRRGRARHRRRGVRGLLGACRSGDVRGARDAALRPRRHCVAPGRPAECAPCST